MKQNISSQQRRPSRGRSTGSSSRGRSNGKVIAVSEGQPSEGRSKSQLLQSMEKFLGLARDAQASGDRVAAESYFQHADHFYRLLSMLKEATIVQPVGKRAGEERVDEAEDREGGEYEEALDGETQ